MSPKVKSLIDGIGSILDIGATRSPSLATLKMRLDNIKPKRYRMKDDIETILRDWEINREGNDG